MPARRPSKRRLFRRSQKQNVKKLDRYKLFTRFALFFLVLLLLYSFVNSSTLFWNGKSKLSIVVDEGNDVSVLTFDPANDSLTHIIIPGDTEVMVARELGRWRLKNVGKLGKSENLEGLLTAETLTKYFKFPTYAWASQEALGFYKGDLASRFSAVFSPYKTNLGMGDKFKLLYFSFYVKNFKKEEIDLSDTRYLKDSVLTDGESGYVLSGSIPGSIAAIFADPYVVQDNGRAKIIDKTKRGVVGEKLGEVVEVMGFKVLSVSQESSDDMDCTVSGVNMIARETVSKIFGCEEVESDSNDLGIIITVGEGFEDRY